MKENIILLILIAMNLKWILLLIFYPFMAINGHNREKSPIWKIAAAPYLVLEVLLRGGWMRYALFQIGTIPSLHLRKWLYMGLGARIGKRVVIHFRTEIRSPQHLILGKGTIIGDNSILDARMGLTIGENVNLSSNVSIYTLQHDHRDPLFACNPTARKMSVEIDNRAWIGSNVVVLPGVHIGEGAVCCAGCVVAKDVEPYAVVAGIPAKKVSERPRVLKYEFTGGSCRLY